MERRRESCLQAVPGVKVSGAKFTLEDKLVVAISSRALFDFEEENRVFETGDLAQYEALQRSRLEMPAKPGVAFGLIQKLLALNADEQRGKS